MVLFTLLSFLTLGFGSIVLSLLTLMGRGNRTFAFMLAISTVALGLFMYFGLDQSGLIPAGLGVVALIVASLPGKKREPYTEDFD
jgi:uncharacterized membrane protein YedE/YeeE